jgi:two-component system, cell cycle sensor histidine kinase and response regulator CckA
MAQDLRLLLVDDNSFDADLLQHNLSAIRGLKCQFDWVTDFQSGLERVCENSHDVCLIDHYLGPESGTELIRQALQRGCRKPLVLYSGKEDVALGIQAIALGAVDYIVKDHIEPFMLEKTLRGILERERILIENARVQSKMYDAQRLESLGLMASGIAHDFNNILGIILANAELGLKHSGNETAAHRYLSSIRLATERAAELTSQMLAYSGRGRSRLQILDLADLASETIEFCRVGIPRRVDIVSQLPATLAPVHGDPTQMRQVVVNLLNNASDAITGEGQITCEAFTAQAPENPAEASAFVPPIAEGAYSVLRFSDTGCGMNPEQQVRIFDPFFTTKSTGRGLGLAAVLGIVKGHHGSMRVTSRLGEGTRFEIWIPQQREPVPQGQQNPQPPPTPQHNLGGAGTGGARSPAGPAAKTAAPPAGSGSPPQPQAQPPAQHEKGSHAGYSHPGYVMVVDDEKGILQALEVMLQARGYHTQLAADAESALGLIEAKRQAGNGGGIEAAVLDVMLAGRSGVELFRDLRAKIPDLPVVFISGYNESDALIPLVRSGEVQYLRKPFSSTQLMQALEKAFARKHALSA